MIDARGIEEQVPLLRATVAPPPMVRGTVTGALDTGSSDAEVGTRDAGVSPPSTSRPSRTMAHSTPSALESYFELNVYMVHAKRFLSDLKPYDALVLVPLSFGEMALTKLTGTVAGNVYKSLVDLDSGLFYTTVYKAAIYYALFATLAAAQEYVKNSLALTWRRRLTTIVHRAYFQDPRKMSEVHAKLDNCDQRITSEVGGLCSTLADIVHKVAASPFKIIFYGYLAGSYIGFMSLCLVVAFFVISVWLQKLVALPLARDLVRLEKQEGDFRSSHMRVRRAGTDIALQVEQTAEEQVVQRSLCEVLGVQGTVVWRRTAVMAVTRVVDYGGAIMNYVVIAVAIFLRGAGGSRDPSDGSGGGERAAFVSNASFFTLTLIYTLTEVVDLGPALSTLTSLLCRVYGMLEALESGREGSLGVTNDTVNRAEHGELSDTGSTHLGSTSSPRGEYEMILAPSHFQLGDMSHASSMNPRVMEVAVITLRGSLLDEVAAVFPSLPLDRPSCSEKDRKITCMMTLQPRQPLDIDSMDASLNVFLEWDQAVVEQLSGAWCDAVDPKTGKALRDTSTGKSASWSEVRAFHTFLRYPVDERGVCPLIVHPVYGSETYPVSFFTTASPKQCIDVLRKIGSLQDRPGLASNPAVLLIQNETIRCGWPNAGEGAPMLTGINVQLEPGRHVLITGPNGSGKTTLVRYLCQRLQQQDLDDRPHRTLPYPQPRRTRYMYLPQVPLIGPGKFLWQQLAYPGDKKPDEGDMLDALRRVGLGHLAPWLQERPSTTRDWSRCLSFGEQQRICIARVCLRKPIFALMDEATSGMDAASSLSLLREVQQVATVILVSHNVENISEMFSTRVDL